MVPLLSSRVCRTYIPLKIVFFFFFLGGKICVSDTRTRNWCLSLPDSFGELENFSFPLPKKYLNYKVAIHCKVTHVLLV